MLSRPPTAPGHDPADAPGTPLRAVLTGVALDVCATKLIGTALVLMYMAQISTPQMTPDQLETALREHPPTLALFLFDAALESLASVLAGYACARIVQRDELRIGGVMAVLAVLLGLMLGGGAGDDELTLLSMLGEAGCLLLGVQRGVAYNRRARGAAPAPADASSP